MARSGRLQSLSFYLVDSSGAARRLVSSAASIPSLPFNHSDNITAICPSSPSRLVPVFAGSTSFSSPSQSPSPNFNRSRLLRRSSLITDVAPFSCSPFSYGISSSPSSYGMARSFFSGSRGKTSEASGDVPSALAPADPPQEGVQVQLPKEFMDAANNTVIFIRDTATSSIAWTHDSLENLLHVLRVRFDLPEYPSDTATQLLYTTIATVLAWLVMPRVFRMFHKYFEDGSHLLLRAEKVPYERSVWSSLEDPAKIFISVMAFSQLSSLIAPTTIASHYLHQIWKGSAVVALVWFLHRWKSNVISRILANPNLGSDKRELFHALEKISSMGLFILGGMGVAEACGIAAYSILTVGGVGGVATAFAARDILGNMLSGFALQFMKPFSIGDTIKAGPVEGQVLDIGLTATQMLDLDKFPVAVPNSFFSSQVIVNKSRATWRAFSIKIPVQLNDFEKVPQITQEIRNMLKSHPGVTLQNGVPLCHASRITGTSLEVTIQCNLTFKGREDLLSTEQDITLQTLKIISNAGATLSVAV